MKLFLKITLLLVVASELLVGLVHLLSPLVDPEFDINTYWIMPILVAIVSSIAFGFFVLSEKMKL